MKFIICKDKHKISSADLYVASTDERDYIIVAESCEQSVRFLQDASGSVVRGSSLYRPESILFDAGGCKVVLMKTKILVNYNYKVGNFIAYKRCDANTWTRI